jgi:hypothetical protein
MNSATRQGEPMAGQAGTVGAQEEAPQSGKALDFTETQQNALPTAE